MEKKCESCENKPNVTVMLPECDETSIVEVPREEYAEMVSEVTILRVVEALVRMHEDAYALIPMLKTVIALGDGPKAEAPEAGEDA